MAGRALESAVAAIGTLYLPFGTICLIEAPALLSLLFGDGYAASSSGTLRWLAAAPMVYGLAYLSNAALQARGRHGAMLACAVGGTVANVGLNLLLIPLFGGAAAAFATTASYLLVAAGLLTLLHRDGVRVVLLVPLREPALASLVLAAVLLVSPLPLLVELPLAGLLYLGCWWSLLRWWAPEQAVRLRQLVLPGATRAG